MKKILFSNFAVFVVKISLDLISKGLIQIFNSRGDNLLILAEAYSFANKFFKVKDLCGLCPMSQCMTLVLTMPQKMKHEEN